MPDTQLAPMITALATKIRNGKVTVTALGDIARYFTYDKSFTDVNNRNILDAISEFETACHFAFGNVPQNVVLRFRKGTVQGGDLARLYKLT